jgi:dTDP-4-dehydrorhamnose reductase
MRLLVLVVGASGQLGEAFVTGLAGRHEIVARTRQQLDIAVPGAAREAIGSICPDVVINCAAMTDVDGAEARPAEAFETNALAVRSIARAAAAIDALLVHYSTDFVFDGASETPYVETDAPRPQSTYAMSKLVGEWFAAEAPRHYVLRVESLFGGDTRKSSVDKILANIVEGREVRAFADRTVSPSYVEDVVEATRALIEGAHPYGVYHCVNSGWTTWLGLARELAARVHRPDAKIVGIQMADAKLKASRPRFAALSNAKLDAEGICLPSWQDAIARYTRQTLVDR